MGKNKGHSLNITVPDDKYDQIQSLAKLEKRSVANLLRVIIYERLEQKTNGEKSV